MTVAAPGRQSRLLADQIVWDALAAPVAGPDTLLLARLGTFADLAASGGKLVTNTATGFRDDQATAAGFFEFDPTGGAFGNGAFRGTGGTSGGIYATWPLDGLLALDGGAFIWRNSAPGGWSDATLANKYVAQIRNDGSYVRLQVGNAGTVSLTASHLSSQPAGTAGKASASFSNVALPGGMAASTSTYTFALIYRAGAWRFYVNGTQVGSTLTIDMPSLHHSDPALGVYLGGSLGVPNGLWYSDLEVRRTPLNPGVAVSRRSVIGSLQADTAGAGVAVPPTAIGALHTAQPSADPAVCGAVAKVVRTGKGMTATPIKAGGTDATHPTLGQSGLYSYDWQVLDRTITAIKAYGARLWMEIGNCPQILGGSIAPLSGSQLTTDFIRRSSFAGQIPNDQTAFLHMTRDYVDRIVNYHGVTNAWWTFWNEPANQWADGTASYCDWFVLVAAAIRDISPGAIVGGPEAAGANTTVMTFINTLMARCVATSTQLDFISVHDYSGDIDGPLLTAAHVNKLAADNGLAVPMPLAYGEFNWSGSSMYKEATNQFQKWTEAPWTIRSFGASYAACWIAEVLKQPSFKAVAYAHLDTVANAFGDGSPRNGGYSVDQLLGPQGQRWASYNVLQGFQMVLGDVRLPLTEDLPPGVHGYISRDTATGRIGVMIGSFGWANTATRKVILHLTGMTGNKRLRRYLIDQSHSSAWDNLADPGATTDRAAAGSVLPQEILLEKVEDRTASGVALRDLTIDVPKWSVQFLTLDPA